MPTAVKLLCTLSLCAGVGGLTPRAAAKCLFCKTKTDAPSRQGCRPESGDFGGLLPPNAKPGECYEKVYMPPEFKTVTERVKLRDAYEQLEVVPAKYEWVEEKVCVKDAAEALQVAPAEFAAHQETLEVKPADTEWEINKNPSCVADTNQPARDTFCLVSHPAVQQTIDTQCLLKPAHVEKVLIPAEYQTIRRQKLVCPATVRKVCIPAEYKEVQKTIKVCEGRMVWKLVNCSGREGVVSDAHNMSPQAAGGAALVADRH